MTRTDLAILEAYAEQIAERASTFARGGDDRAPARIVEPGAGSGTKTRLLLRALGPRRCVEYVPVDIAAEHLEHMARELHAELPWLRVTPFAADFSAELPLPSSEGDDRTLVYFPGSTIGNFDPEDAKRLLDRFPGAPGPNGLVLLGSDLKRDPALLHAAYNDAQGITEVFNKNLLLRMNAELGADLDLSAFQHYAFYAPVSGRVEMHLVSARRQSVRVGGDVFTFAQGESICTERSYKYDLAGAERLGRGAGLALADA